MEVNWVITTNVIHLLWVRSGAVCWCLSLSLETWSVTRRTSSVWVRRLILPAQLGEGSQTGLSVLEHRKHTAINNMKKITMKAWVVCFGTLNTLLPFFSGDAMNITAMLKRRTFDRLLRISSITAGVSFLHRSLSYYTMQTSKYKYT